MPLMFPAQSWELITLAQREFNNQIRSQDQRKWIYQEQYSFTLTIVDVDSGG